jgi:hypothetical protein
METLPLDVLRLIFLEVDWKTYWKLWRVCKRWARLYNEKLMIELAWGTSPGKEGRFLRRFDRLGYSDSSKSFEYYFYCHGTGYRTIHGIETSFISDKEEMSWTWHRGGLVASKKII